MSKCFFLKQLAIAMGLITVVGMQAALAQTFPTKLVTVVVPFPPGGGPDLMARVFAEKLAAKWGRHDYKLKNYLNILIFFTFLFVAGLTSPNP